METHGRQAARDRNTHIKHASAKGPATGMEMEMEVENKEICMYDDDVGKGQGEQNTGAWVPRPRTRSGKSIKLSQAIIARGVSRIRKRIQIKMRL